MSKKVKVIKISPIKKKNKDCVMWSMSNEIFSRQSLHLYLAHGSYNG